jgi:hypothetical protein
MHAAEIRRFYGMDHGGGYHDWRKISAVATKFDLDKAQSVKPKGHCVAVRVTSEDPDDGFKPTSGRVEVGFNWLEVLLALHLLCLLICYLTFSCLFVRN